MSKYLDIIYDANNKVKVGIYEFNDKQEIKQIYQMLKGNKHIQSITRDGYKLTITYKQRTP